MPAACPGTADRPVHVALGLLPLLLAAALALPGCGAPDPARPVAYHALSGEEVRGHMRALGTELAALVELTSPEAPRTGARRAAVVGSLERIEARAREVGGGGRLTNHAAVNDYMDGFLSDVALAREFARREPPNLVPARRLPRSCLACHQSL